MIKLHQGDGLQVMETFESDFVDSIVTDPPYGLKFMGKKWDYDVPSVEIWKENLRVLKPGGTALIFAGSRTQHRMAINIEDAGFILKDCIMWLYGSGFPKSTDISKQIDKKSKRLNMFHPFADHLKNKIIESGLSKKEISKHFPSKTGGLTGCVWNWENAESVPTKEQFIILKRLLNLSDEFTDLIDRVEAEREVIGKKTAGIGSGKTFAFTDENCSADKELDITAPATPEAQLWEGYGTALKPAYETIIVAQKPNDGTYGNNALKHRVSGLNIDGCLVATEEILTGGKGELWSHIRDKKQESAKPSINEKGRWPANIIHDGSDEVLNLFPETQKSKGNYVRKTGKEQFLGVMGDGKTNNPDGLCDSGSAARFFFCAKASKKERGHGNNHPTVKPLALMKYLCKLVCPPFSDAVILDSFMGSGTTGKACVELGINFIGIEDVPESFKIAEKRINEANAQLRF